MKSNMYLLIFTVIIIIVGFMLGPFSILLGFVFGIAKLILQAIEKIKKKNAAKPSITPKPIIIDQELDDSDSFPLDFRYAVALIALMVGLFTHLAPVALVVLIIWGVQFFTSKESK